MMRIGPIAVGLSTLIVMEMEPTSRTKTSGPDRFDQLTVDVSISHDTLEAADRIEIHHLQHEAPFQPVLPVEPTLPPDVITLVAIVEVKPCPPNALDRQASNLSSRCQT